MHSQKQKLIFRIKFTEAKVWRAFDTCVGASTSLQ